MPPAFRWPEGAQFWLSHRSRSAVPDRHREPLTDREVSYFQAIGRLRSGVTLDSARQDMQMAGEAIQREHAQTSGGRAIRLTPIRENLVGGVRDALVVIQAVGLVLLIACANDVRSPDRAGDRRRRELAIRAALGAGRGHLLRQLLAESLVLGVAGGIGGLLLSAWLVGCS